MLTPEEQFDIIDEFFTRLKRRTLWIQTHDIPDPDALASAEAFRLIARHHGVNARIIAHGFPHRRENKALMKECKIHLKPLDSMKIRISSRSAWVFIDCLPGKGNVTLHSLAPGEIFLAIDHHVRDDNIPDDDDPGLYIIEQHVGATATILGRYLIARDIAFPPRLASALSYAIITDTQDFSRGASTADIEVYAAMFPRASQKIISKLRNTTKSRHYFATVHKSLSNAYFYRHVSWVYIGEVDSGEFVAEMADFILSCERITWALALGFHGDRLYLSLRSTNPKSRCGQVIHRLVDSDRGASGGHDMFAGGFLFLEDGVDPVGLAKEVFERFLRIVLRLPRHEETPVGTPLVEDADEDGEKLS